MGYDSKCFELAEAFVNDERYENQDVRLAMTKELAQEIQDTIEGYFFDVGRGVRPGQQAQP